MCPDEKERIEAILLPFRGTTRYNSLSMPTGRERGETNNMKYLAILALAATAFTLGACAKPESHQQTTTMSHTGTSYSK